MWTYDQSTGLLYHGGVCVARGYSGHGAGRNNPSMQAVRNVGPIPCGKYRIGPPCCLDGKGAHVLGLTPLPETFTFGRSGFLIHGDSVAAPGTASHGCIILGRPIREEITESGDDILEVVNEPELPRAA